MAFQVRPILIPDFSDWTSARQVISQQLQSLQQSIASQLPLADYNGSRVSNVGPPQQMNDAVTLGYLQQNYDSRNLTVSGSGGGGGAITLTVPPELTVSGSPVVNGNGTLAVSKAVEDPHTAWMGGTSTTTIAPVFRLIIPSDLPIATSTSSGIVSVDGTSITISSGTITAVGGTSTGVIIEHTNTLQGGTAAGNIILFTPSTAGLYQVSNVLSINTIATDEALIRLTWEDQNLAPQVLDWVPNLYPTGTLSLGGPYLYPSITVWSGTANPISVDLQLPVSGGTINYDAGASILKVG